MGLLGRFLFLGPAFGHISLKVLHVNLAIVVVRLVLIHVIAVNLGKLLEYVTLLLTSHLLSVATLLDFVSNLLLDLLFHGFWHIRFSFHEHGHTVIIVLLLVQFKLIETTLFLLLVVVVLSRLLLLNLPFSLFQALVEVLKNILLLISGLLLFFLGINFE